MQQKIISPHALDLCTSFSYVFIHEKKRIRILGKVS